MSEWSTGRCPACHRQIQIESGCLAECVCGWSEDEDQDEFLEEDEEED